MFLVNYIRRSFIKATRLKAAVGGYCSKLGQAKCHLLFCHKRADMDFVGARTFFSLNNVSGKSKDIFVCLLKINIFT